MSFLLSLTLCKPHKPALTTQSHATTPLNHKKPTTLVINLRPVAVTITLNTPQQQVLHKQSSSKRPNNQDLHTKALHYGTTSTTSRTKCYKFPR